ncbi:LysR family transcriptional regulator [Rhodoplanes sp. Z2-YC6860]|uniref:LysR family transcriptional regulator n=1 Tax=Rhodoplanes sp. Z2-YC6860 TaxID=674703 RepID=UPI00078C86A5|nr:LysR family transcriptional regulator [Rhodoplanes sp. Z2-YC6860]AMN39277.1 LysR family transcriptional regulator [Rhodoplanes sp. Z2-YC6860]
MDRLTSMHVFAKIVASGSFAAAARQAQLSPTVVSKHVQALESWLGARLLNRSTRRVALTEAGEAFYERCTRILSEVEDATGAASALQTTLRGRLRVSAPGLFGVEQVTPAAVSFMAKHPDVSVRLDLNDRYVDVLGEGYDLAVIVSHLPDSSLIARRLAPIRFVTCAAPSYLERRGTPQHPSELRFHDCLQYNGFLWPRNEWRFVAANGDPVTTQLSPRFASATLALRIAVLQGAGVLLCPTYAVGADLAAGRLVPILTEFSIPELTAYAVHAQGRHRSAKLGSFIDLLVARFGPNPPWDRWRDA